MNFSKGTIASVLKRTAIEMFIKLLDRIDGNKDLVLSSELILTFDLIFGFNHLKSNGVQKIYKLESTTKSFSSQKVCYVIRPTLMDTQMVANSINVVQTQESVDDIQYWLIFVPQKLQICDECLEREGVYQLITILEYPLGLIPLDVDLLSLECPQFYKNCFISGEESGLNHINHCLNQLQALIGPFGSAYTNGKYSNIVSDLLTQNNANKRSKSDENTVISNGMISNLILVDRDEDYVSLMLSQLNYIGVIDETFSIKSGKVEFGKEILKSSDNNNVKHNLFNDIIFDDIKDIAFSSVFISLKEKGQKLKEVYNRSQNMNISAMKAFVSNELKNLQNQQKALFLHITASEKVMESKKEICFSQQLNIERNLIEGIESKASIEFIEEGIIRQFSPFISLRLLCLYSITQSGIASKDYRNLIKLFLQSYGHKFIQTLFNLKKLGIISENMSPTLSATNNPLSSTNMMSFLRSTESIRKFRQTIKKLNLIPTISSESYDIRNPKDCAYVFGGAYIPLITRVIELVCDSKNSNQEISKLLNGKFINLNQRLKPLNYTKIVPKAVLVFLIGGITYAEVSALRFLAKQMGIQIIIATTSVTNGSEFLKHL